MATADPAAGAASTTESEEMYLIHVAMAVEDGHDPVPVPHLAAALSVSKVAANEKIKKLDGRGLVSYTPYRGVRLTSDGDVIARAILRRRRLWALFLSEHLGLTPAAADAVACEFEHVTPSEVAGRLASFLGDPTVGPSGKPIPSDEGGAAPAREVPLAELLVGNEGLVVRTPSDAATRSFLGEEGIVDGATLALLAVGDDGGCLVRTTHGTLHLSPSIAASVMVSPA